MTHLLNESIIAVLRKKVSKHMRHEVTFTPDVFKSQSFRNIIDQMINENDFSCQKVFELFKVICDEHHFEIGDEFLLRTYDYSISLSFPDAVDVDGHDEHLYRLYLKMLQVINEFQKCSKDQTFMSVYPFELLKNEEIIALESPYEYIKFSKAFRKKHVYEMMKLNHELLGRSTIEHILGVHYLALKIARQLKEKGIAVDLGRVSGAAAGHDLGKFGCRPEEIKKIAYYHYYYTDVWFQSLDIHYIKNVAVYHSTWDLELESLSIESLILIFSDFCVKRSKEKEGLFMMKFLTVDEAFDTILNKLDNVDEKKKRRYEKVYLKLKNFHDYLQYHGVICTVNNYTRQGLKEDTLHEHLPFSSIDTNACVVDHLKIEAIQSSVDLMYQLRDINSLNQILFQAKNEKDVLMLRRYLFIFEEYSTYLTPEQKMVTLKFLNHYMIHREEDIRAVSSRLVGRLLADYDENYTKELPPRANITYSVTKKFEVYERLMNQFFFEDIHLTPVKRKRQVISYYWMIESLLEFVNEHFKEKVIRCMIGYYRQSLDQYGEQFLLELITLLPKAYYEKIWMKNYILKQLDGPNQMLALKRIHDLSEYQDFDVTVHENQPFGQAMNYLLSSCDIQLTQEAKSNIYLSNLKSATSKEIKATQIEMLYQHAMTSKEEQFYLAMHCCNLLKVSEYEQVRNKAGQTLVLLYEALNSEQKNDIVVELVRALEIEGYGFTRYIPNFLGQLIPKFGLKEYHEIIIDLEEKISSASSYIRTLILDTLGTMIVEFIKVGEVERVESLLGLLFKGFYSNKLLVMQMAFKVLSKDIIGSSCLTLDQRYDVFKLVYRKLSCFLLNEEHGDLFIRSVGLHYIYHFITDYIHENKVMIFDESRDVAVYMGTFDPFSLGQKLAVEAANDKGFDVYVGISEFQWKRRTQPSKMRKAVVEMSLASRLSVFTLPQSNPINLSLEAGCKQLKEMFKGRNVHLIIGEEALLHMPEYDEENNAVYDFAHIVFKRQHISHGYRGKQMIEEKLTWMTSYETCLLPDAYDRIDADRIRMNIDKNYDPYDVIDDMASQYIKAHKMYRNEPQYKSVVPISDMSIRVLPLKKVKALDTLCENFDLDKHQVTQLMGSTRYPERMMMQIIEASSNRVLGFSIYALGKPKNLFPDIRNVAILKQLETLACEKLLIIDVMVMKEHQKFHALDQIILTETLMFSIKHQCTYALYSCEHKLSEPLLQVIKNSGFLDYPCDYTNQHLMAVNMTNPIVLNLDGTTRMKADYRSNEHIRGVIKKVRKHLQQSICKLYPGHLVVSFDRSMMYNHLIRLISFYNDVSIENDNTLGQHIVVPYGDIFKRWLLPNGITKAFHTERYYDETFLKYHVKAYPGYLSIENQTKVLKAFDKPVILIDDLIDKGHRLMAIYNQLDEKNISVERVISGILSSRGEALLASKGLNVASAYYFPSFKVWFNESDLYPFIGGDSVENQNEKGHNSINLMLPFVYPKYIKDSNREAIYQLAVTCFENAIEIIEAVERTYMQHNNRTLSIERLKEVMITPRIPFIGEHVEAVVSDVPSKFLKHQMNHLMKLKPLYHD